MKRLVFILALLGCAAPWAPPAARAATSYPFTCEVSPANGLEMSPVVSSIAYQASVGPVASGLKPGQCAFADRAVRPNEPVALCFAFSIAAFTAVNGTARSIVFAGPGAAVAKAAMFGPPTLMNFMVHDAGNCMVVDSFGV